MSVYITRRKTAAGEWRYVVRYRWGGRAFRLVHLESKRTLREARSLRDWAAGELAAMRDPREQLARIAADSVGLEAVADLDTWWARFIASRLDTTPGTHRNYGKARERFSPLLGGRNPWSLTVADVQAAVSSLADDLKPSTLIGYVGTLRQVLDYVGVEPNVVRDRRVKLPRVEQEEPEPPDAAHVLEILERLTERWRLAFVTTEQTGMRVGEIASASWGDVDVAGARFRIRARESKSRRAKWVPVPEWLIAEIAATCPAEDRAPTRAVFPRVTEDGLRNAMIRACRTANLPTYSPHDLRHRRISIWHLTGVPTRQIQERVGHSRATTTLGTYSHVMPIAEVDVETLIAAIRRPREVSVRSRR